MKYNLVIVGIFIMFTCGSKDFRSMVFNSYPPRIIIIDRPGVHEIQIPVDTNTKEGKQSFTKVFEFYGFSGNGPAIEQVLRHNIRIEGAIYDSEGDCFRVVFASKESMMRYHALLRPVTSEEVLHRWVYNARNTLFKE